MPLPRLACSLAAVALLTAQSLAAQCADGTTQLPCPRPQAKVARTIDPKRIAILPFRVTTADTLLGEGFAELLAPEFTGEGGPRAIDMSTTLSAWRRAGGGLRNPLSQDAANRLARDIGAGLLAQGSIVGFGGRLTVSAGLFDATTGRAIGTPARAVGPPDSVETLLRQIATNLLSASGATARANDAARITTSLPALRSYLEGMALWRRGRWNEAEAKFTESFADDSTFALPAYQADILTSQTGRGATWQRRVIALRDRLPARERTVVEEMYMANSGPLADRIASRRRAAERLVDAPEAWFVYGDYVYHSGHSVFGPDSAVAIAQAAFNRAIALDPVPIFLYHVMENAIMRRDTATARRMLNIYERIEGEEGWSKSWALAAFLGDNARLARLRQRGPDTASTVVSVVSFGPVWNSRIPAALVEEGYRRLEPALDAAELNQQRLYHWVFERARGRPASAERALPDPAANIFRILFVPGAWLSGDAENDAAVLARYGATQLADSLSESRRQCLRGIVGAAQGHADTLDLEALRTRVNTRCLRLLEGWKQFAATGASDSLVARMEGLLDGIGYTNFIGYENRLTARMYESRGDLPRARAAIDRYPREYTGAWMAPTLREQGRLALLARDTTAALRAYEHFLELRVDAEGAFVAERDSVRGIVGRLRRR